MAVPTSIIAAAIRFAVRAGLAALKGGRIISKFDITQIGSYLVEVERRWELGRDKAISTIVRIKKGGATQEVWHVISKGLRVLAKHRK